MEVRLLGTLEVEDRDGPLVVSGAKLRALLAALALRPGQVVSGERLVEELWGQAAKATAANSLQGLVSKLRRALPVGSVVTQLPGYMLDVAAESVDVGRFERLVAEGRMAMAGGDAAGAATAFGQGLALWRGPPLAEFVYEEFAQSAIARLGEERATALEDRVEADLACGRHAELVAELEAAVGAQPLRERLRAQLMLALYRSGRQADGLRQFQEARRVLGEELGLEPGPELRGLEAAMLAHDPSLRPPPPPPPSLSGRRRRTNLRAPLTPTIGREQELADLAALVARHRLVTVVGPGGAGKTRLAIETARSMQDTFEHGAWLVELAPLGDPAALAPAMATALGLPDLPGVSFEGDQVLGRLADFLADGDSLVVLDNCEHLIGEAAGLTAALLSRCAGLRILATSRERLGVQGERLWPTRPLALDDAVALFAERAGAVAPSFTLDGGTRPLAADICVRLDGLPLAIELAAAKVRAFTLIQIASRLDERFRLLTGGLRTAEARQQTLHAVVDWSYDLLFEDERRLFDRLSVFAGGWDMRAAETVCADEMLAAREVAEIVARLVDKSLVVVDVLDGQARLSMLQTLADYGHERLVSSGEAEEFRRRHAVWCADLAGLSYTALIGNTSATEWAPNQRQWLQTVSENLNNLRSALDWALETEDAEIAHTIAGGLGWYWWLCGNADEGLRWLDIAVGCPGTALRASRARTMTWTAFLRLVAGRPLSAASADEAIAAYEQSDDRYGLAVASIQMVQVYQAVGQSERIEPLVINARALLESLGDESPVCRAVVVWCDGFLALLRGDAALAERDMQAYVMHPDNSSEFTTAITLIYLADMREAREDYAAATRDLERAHALGVELTLRGQEVPVLARLANLATLAGDHRRAGRLHDDAVEAARAIGYGLVLARALDVIAARQLGFGHLDAAADAAARALTLHKEAEDAGGARALLVLGRVAESRDNHQAASALYAEALEAAHHADDGRETRAALEGLAATSMMSGDTPRAARLLGLSRQLHNRHVGSASEASTAGDGFVVAASGDDAEERAQRLELAAKATLGARAFDAAMAEGKSIDVSQLLQSPDLTPT